MKAYINIKAISSLLYNMDCVLSIYIVLSSRHIWVFISKTTQLLNVWLTTNSCRAKLNLVFPTVIRSSVDCVVFMVFKMKQLGLTMYMANICTKYRFMHIMYDARPVAKSKILKFFLWVIKIKLFVVKNNTLLILF